MARPSRIGISNSKIKKFLRCEQAYVYRYVQGLTHRRPALPLKLGLWIHSLVEAKYVSGSWKMKQAELTEDFEKMFLEEKAVYGPLPDRARIVMQGYDHYWRHEDQEWDFKEIETEVEIDLNRHWYYKGRLDVVAENDEGLWIWDHKSFKKDPPTADFRMIDPQSSLYTWAYEKMTGIRPAGFMFNYIRTKVPSMPRILKNGTVSKARLDTNSYTLLRWFKKQGLNPQDYTEMVTSARARDSQYYHRVFISRPPQIIRSILQDIISVLPRIRELHEGRRPTRSLSRNCQFDCEFNQICLLEMIGGDSSFMRKHDFIIEEDPGGQEETIIAEAD